MKKHSLAMFVLVIILLMGLCILPALPGEQTIVRDLAGRWFIREIHGAYTHEHNYDLVPTGGNNFKLIFKGWRMIPRLEGAELSRHVRYIIGSIEGRQIRGEFYTKTLPDQYSSCKDPGVSVPITGNISENKERIVIIVPEADWVNLANCKWERGEAFTMTFER